MHLFYIFKIVQLKNYGYLTVYIMQSHAHNTADQKVSNSRPGENK